MCQKALDPEHFIRMYSYLQNTRVKQISQFGTLNYSFVRVIVIKTSETAPLVWQSNRKSENLSIFPLRKEGASREQ